MRQQGPNANVWPQPTMQDHSLIQFCSLTRLPRCSVSVSEDTVLQCLNQLNMIGFFLISSQNFPCYSFKPLPLSFAEVVPNLIFIQYGQYLSPPESASLPQGLSLKDDFSHKKSMTESAEYFSFFHVLFSQGFPIFLFFCLLLLYCSGDTG